MRAAGLVRRARASHSLNIYTYICTCTYTYIYKNARGGLSATRSRVTFAHSLYMNRYMYR